MRCCFVKVKSAAVFLFLTMVLSVSCTANTPTKPHSATSEERSSYTIQWLVADEKARSLDGYALTNSEVFSEIALKTGVKINVVSAGIKKDIYIKKLLLSNNLPDLLTLSSSDPNAASLINANLVHSLETFFLTFSPKDAGIIPHNAWETLKFPGDMTLYGIPGNYFGKNVQTAILKENQIAREGIFVREDIYEKLGRPDLSSPTKFLEVIEYFMDYYRTFIEDNGEPLYPIVFGQENEGIRTLERVFGIMPLQVENEVKHRIFCEMWEEYTVFINRIGKAVDYNDMVFSLTDSQFDQVMQSNAFIYIGSTDYIRRFNEKNEYMENGVRFIRTDQLKVSEQSSYAAYNSYGEHLTYVLKGVEEPKMLIDLIRFLMSEQGSLLTRYGIEEKHWIDKGDGVIVTGLVKNWIKKDDAGFRRITGIGLFPYMMNRMVEPLLQEKSVRTVDVSLMEIHMVPIPTTPEGLVYGEIEDRIYNAVVKAFSAQSQSELDAIVLDIKSMQELNGINLLSAYFSGKYMENMQKSNYQP